MATEEATLEVLKEPKFLGIFFRIIDSLNMLRGFFLFIIFICKKNVWTKIPRKVAVARGWKIIKTKWIDINKGDHNSPIYRSRFVGKEFNNGEMDGLFAGTPPLGALRLLLSDAASMRKGGRGKVAMINDVSRAFFEAPMQPDRHLCIELPMEDLSEEQSK